MLKHVVIDIFYEYSFTGYSNTYKIFIKYKTHWKNIKHTLSYAWAFMYMLRYGLVFGISVLNYIMISCMFTCF